MIPPRLAVLALALLVPIVIAPSAAAKSKRRCKVVRIHGHKKRVCHKVKPKRVPISATVLDGSNATIDFGDGTVRTVGLTGRFTGYVPGSIKLNTDTKAFLTGGSLSVAPTDFFSDGCTSPVWARSDPATRITLDRSKTNTATLHANGQVESDANVIIRAVLDARPQNACDQQLTQTGYADSTAAVHLAGSVGSSGLTSLQLSSAPYPLTLNACMTAGTPAYPCAGPLTSYPTTATVLLKVGLSLG